MSACDVSVAIAHWNVRDLLDDCLASVFAGTRGVAFEVIVVDNGSTDGSADMVREKYPQVRLVINAANLGYTVATNQAIRLSQGRYVLLLNSDTLVGPGALPAMVSLMDAAPTIGALGCRLVFPDGSLQMSCYRFHTLGNRLAHALFLHRLLPGGLGLVWDTEYETRHDVDWLMGTCLMARREAVEQVGLLDERIFVGGGDQDWCYRFWQKGWRVTYSPAATVVHHHGKSSLDYEGPNASAQQRRFLLEEVFSDYYFLARHRGRLQAWLYFYLIAKLGAVVRLIVWTAAYVTRARTFKPFQSQPSYAAGLLDILRAVRPGSVI